MDTLKLHQPSFNLKKFGYRAFSVAGPRIWNDLQREIRHSPSVTSFKQALKTHLYRRELFPQLTLSFLARQSRIGPMDDCAY